MKLVAMAARGRQAGVSGMCFAACWVLGAAFSPALMAQTCPVGQRLYSTFVPTGLVLTSVVPGSAGGFPSGVQMKPGYHYDMTATGSIRVGVFGETGTPPDGWVPQGSAGTGFPDPDAYTFSLLFRVGSTGAWQLLGSGHSVAKLGPYDPPGTQIQFGINDTKLSDNSGFFNVVITELAPGTKCESPPASQPMPMYARSGSSSGGTPAGPKLPCPGITPDGRMLSFQFQMLCPGNVSRNLPEQACTRQDALTQAAAMARSDQCILQNS